MKKQTRKTKTSLKSSVLVLLLVAILLISSSYAWFTANQTVSISSITVNVEASNGIQISTDATTWKSIITNADITNASSSYSAAVNQFPSTLSPVSSAGQVTNGKLDIYYGDVSNDPNTGNFIVQSIKQTDANGTSGYYIAFDFFLKVNVSTPIYITTTSQMVAAGSTDVGLQNAARLAFINEGNSAGNAAACQALNGGTTSILWEPNYDVHTAKAVQAASDYYGISTSTTGASALAYNAFNGEFSNQALIQRGGGTPTGMRATTPTIRTVKDFTTQPSFLTLSSDVTKFRCYMWIEGQDVDCENGASGTDMTFNVGFTMNA